MESKSSYERVKEICRHSGVFGSVVYLLESKTEEKRNFAGKLVCNSDYSHDIEKEIQNLKLLAENSPSKNIIQYIGYEHEVLQHNRKAILLIMELCDGTLDQFVKNKEFQSVRPNKDKELTSARGFFSDLTKLDALKQAALGVEYLHANEIIHRDLKPTNFLLLRSKGITQVKVCDFGLSRRIPTNQSGVNTKPNGTRAFRSCESYRDGMKIGKSLDIFSLGVVFYYVLTDGSHPFGDDDDHQVVNIRDEKSPDFNQLRFNLQLEMTEEQTVTASDLIRRMISHDQEQRFDIQQVLVHPLFWDAKKKVEFYVKINDVIPINQLKKPYEGFLSKDGKGREFEVDINRLPDIVSTKFMQPKQCNEYRRLKDLLQLFRNLYSHLHDQKINKSRETAEKLRKCFMSRDGKEVNLNIFLDKITGPYPQLLVHLYETHRSEYSKIGSEFYVRSSGINPSPTDESLEDPFQFPSEDSTKPVNHDKPANHDNSHDQLTNQNFEIEQITSQLQGIGVQGPFQFPIEKPVNHDKPANHDNSQDQLTNQNSGFERMFCNQLIASSRRNLTITCMYNREEVMRRDVVLSGTQVITITHGSHGSDVINLPPHRESENSFVAKILQHFSPGIAIYFGGSGIFGKRLSSKVQMFYCSPGTQRYRKMDCGGECLLLSWDDFYAQSLGFDPNDNGVLGEFKSLMVRIVCGEDPAEKKEIVSLQLKAAPPFGEGVSRWLSLEDVIAMAQQ